MKENKKEIEDIKFNVNKQQDFIMNFKATNYNFQDHFRQIDVRLAKDKVETERLVAQLKKKLENEHARIIQNEKNIESMETALAFQVKQRKELLDLVRD